MSGSDKTDIASPNRMNGKTNSLPSVINNQIINRSDATDVTCSLDDSRYDSMVFAQGESRMLGGIFNYTNVIIGAGIVAMPYACK